MSVDEDYLLANTMVSEVVVQLPDLATAPGAVVTRKACLLAPGKFPHTLYVIVSPEYTVAQADRLANWILAHEVDGEHLPIAVESILRRCHSE